MLISDSAQFVYVHIQKTGGTSVKNALRATVVDSYPAFGMPLAGVDPIKGPHAHAVDIRTCIGTERWESYYTFAFVRNPWARLVSWYQCCMHHPANDFRRFVRRHAVTFDRLFELSGTETSRLWVNQLDYLSDSTGTVLVKCIGRYERLKDDFAGVCKVVGLHAELPHVNRGPVVDYREFYTEHTKQIVRERFAKDIEAFGYTFDGSADVLDAPVRGDHPKPANEDHLKTGQRRS